MVIDQDILKVLNGFTTPTLSNAINKLNLANPTKDFSDSSIRCLYPELGIMIGVAMTVEIETMNSNVNVPGPGPIFFELLKQVEATNSPVVIVAKELVS